MSRSPSHSSSYYSTSSSESSRHHHDHRLHYHSSSSSSTQRGDQYSISSALSEQYRDIRGYVVDVHPDDYRRVEYPRTMVPEPMLTSTSLGIHVEPLYPDTPQELEREVTPRFRLREEVIYDNDIFEVVSKPRLAREGRRETFRYVIRHKHDHDQPIEVLEEYLVRIPARQFETGAIVKLERDGRKYEVLGAAFLPQESVWNYKIKRYSASEGGDIKRNAFEGRLSRVDSSSSDSHLSPPPPRSRHSPPRGEKASPKGSFSSLVDTLLFKH